MVRGLLPQGVRAFLVGGALRDLLLDRRLHDMDFVLSADTGRVARSVAAQLGGVTFALDEARETQRVILTRANGSEFILDFIKQNGETIQADLAARDFTINAMAVNLAALDEMIDPLGGMGDLRARSLKACSPTAMQADPVRCLRGLRLANTLGCKLENKTIGWIKAALPLLADAAGKGAR